MTVSISNMSQVWMSNTNTYNAIAMSVSTMGYGANANSRLLLFKVDGNTKFSVDANGNIFGNTLTVNTIITASGLNYLPNTSGISFNGNLNFPTGNLVVGKTIVPSVGSTSDTGIRWPIDPGGGAGDAAFLNYYVIGGETTKFIIGTNNDADDTLVLYQFGADRVTLYNGNVGIDTSTPSSKLDVNGLIKDSKGDVRDLPFNSQTSPYALSASDTGKVVSTTSNIFVASSIFSPGQAISVFNSSSTTISIIANSGVTFRLAGQSNNSNRLLSQNGVATIICVAANNFVLSGAGLS